MTFYVKQPNTLERCFAIKFFSVFFLAMILPMSYAYADMVPGPEWYLANCELLLKVHAETESAAGSDSTQHKQELFIDEVIKGISSRQFIFSDTGTLKAGQQALALVQYEHPPMYMPAMQTKIRPAPKVAVWRLDESGMVNKQDIPSQSFSKGFQMQPEPLSLKTIRELIAEQTPEELGLNKQVIDAVLFPAKQALLRQADPERAKFIDFVVVLRGLDRDDLALADLLESRDPEIKNAARMRLQNKFGSKKTDDVIRLLADKAAQSRLSALAKHRWPPVPNNKKIPADKFDAALLAALKNENAAAFAEAFHRWFDAGVLTDRLIQMSAGAPENLLRQNFLSGAVGQSGPLYPPAPRLQPNLIFDQKIAALDRMKALALLTLLYHDEHLVRLRLAAIDEIKQAAPDSETVRRAAFWEPCDTNLQTAGSFAIEKLGTLNGVSAQEDLAAIFLARPTDSSALRVAMKWVKSDHEHFVELILNHARSHRDVAADWSTRILCQAANPQVLPIMFSWLSDLEPKVRETAATNLCWMPDSTAVQPLLTALSKEKLAPVREQLTIALCQSGDTRTLSTLLAVAAEPADSKQLRIEIARGLCRIKDKRALATLAKMATAATDVQVQFEAVNAFGYISGLFKAHRADALASSSGIDNNILKEGLSAIKKWQQEHNTE